MPIYRNGYVPEGLLIKFRTGYNATDGNWFHGFPPATYAKHRALIDRAYKRTGRTLALSDGWAAYRPMFAQEIARRVHGVGAAVPGTSSHGGFWEGRDTMAGDYGNWAWVYQNHGGRAAFAEDCRAVGLWPDMITPGRGYPDEPWHVVDPDPWGPVFAGSDFEEIDMTTVAEFYNTPVTKQPNGADITMAQFMTELWRLGNLIYDDTPRRVWDHTEQHLIAKKADGTPQDTRAGDFLRYESLEHANTRAAMSAITGGAFDYLAFAKALAPELAPLIGDPADPDDIANAVVNLFATQLSGPTG